MFFYARQNDNFLLSDAKSQVSYCYNRYNHYLSVRARYPPDESGKQGNVESLLENIRGPTGPRSMKIWPGRTVLSMIAVVIVLLAGCSEESFLQTAVSNAWVERSAESLEHAAPPQEEPAKPAPPSPRTFPQAIRAYLRCLFYGPPVTSNQAISQAAEQEQSKNPPAEGKSSETANGKDVEKQERSPAENESAGKENGQDADKENGKEQWYSAHAQGTVVTQAHDHFRSPYIGPNSLLPDEHSATSITGTLFLDARLWECGGNRGELVFNPEIEGGRGFSMSSGIAGFPNGEIVRVGIADPTPYIARLYLRQTIGFGGEQETVEAGPNQIAGKRDVDRLTITLGKFSATDLVDNNSYSHDPRTQFLPWSIMYNGAWDYPANVRGYTYGIGIDFNRKNWALRYGIFQEPRFANGAELDPHFLKANGQVLEWEGRYTLYEHPGKLRLLAYLNRAHMGKYSQALEEMPVNPDVTLTRAYRIKYGFGLNWEQELTKELGLFSRFGWDDGHTESWAFTAIDRLAEVGLLLKGKCWCRPNDQVGLALAADGLAKIHHDYLAAGGLDFIIGDGALRYGPEEIFELFYNLAVIKGLNVTVDFQEVVNPAYNRDRGPVSIGSVRVHYEF
jgi:high affinity Mn2+ porin